MAHTDRFHPRPRAWLFLWLCLVPFFQDTHAYVYSAPADLFVQLAGEHPYSLN